MLEIAKCSCQWFFVIVVVEFARRKIFEIGIIRFRQAFVIVVVGFGTGKIVETGRCGPERLFVILVVAFARETML